MDYTTKNLRTKRKGVKGQPGSYIIKFGELVNQIAQKMQEKGVPVFYLAESSSLRNRQDQPLCSTDLDRVKEAFGADWTMSFDAADVSPLRRNRSYLSNIPFWAPDYCDPPPKSCIDDNFDVPVSVLGSAGEDMVTKVQCLMASRSLMDDERSFVYRGQNDSKSKGFEERPLSVSEREVRTFIFL
jgi:hypothetical protein